MKGIGEESGGKKGVKKTKGRERGKEGNLSQ